MGARIKALAAALLTYVAAPASAQVVPEDRQRWEQTQANERRFLRDQFVRHGFVPIEEVAIAGREVRRLQIADPRLFGTIAGVEIERHPAGRVTLRLQYPGWSSAPVAVDPVVWTGLAAAESAAFARPAYPPAPSPEDASQSVCHGWFAWIQADPDRTAGWHGCSTSRVAARDYAYQIMAVAMATRPSCTSDPSDPFASFQRCFSASNALDDSVLEAARAEAQRELNSMEGSNRLAEARRAVYAPGLTLGSPAWREARAAVARLRQNTDQRQEILQRLRTMVARAENPSPADRARLRMAIDHWTDFLNAQERNYSEVVTRLAWAGETQPR